MPKLTIAIPTYNGAQWLQATLDSISSQNFKNFKIIISDDHSTDSTSAIIKKFNQSSLEFFSHPKNLGCGLNLEQLRQLLPPKNSIIFFLCQDDLLLPDALKNTFQAFKQFPKAQTLTRPFYHFSSSPKQPFRAIPPFNPDQNSLLNLANPSHALSTFNSIGQLSGLAFKAEALAAARFHPHVFTTHIHPFLTIAKTSPVIFLKDYTIASRTISSQTLTQPKIYSPSPTTQWISMFKSVLNTKPLKASQKIGIKNICTHFQGLAQIKHYSTYSQLTKEIFLLAKYYPLNLFNPLYYLSSLFFLLTPKPISIRITKLVKIKLTPKP